MNLFSTLRNWRHRQSRPIGFLARLRTDVRGNVLAIMATSLIPLLGFTGAAIDMARLYVVKARLQQACDAGVLAGRKFMTGATLDPTAEKEAKSFFKNNFRTGWFQTNEVVFTPTATADGQVEADASATVPLSIMQFFGGKSVQLEAECQARLDVADVDVMFALDTTGSMSCTPASGASCVGDTLTYTRPDGTPGYYAQEASGSKMQGLRDSVLLFYDTLEAAADESTNIRYGFVTYTSTVNVGYQVRAISNNHLVNNWSYQSRTWVGDSKHPGVDDVVSPDTTGTTKAACDALAKRTPASGYTGSNKTWVTATLVTTVWNNSSGGTCRRTTRTVVPNYDYKPITYDVSQYKSGATIADPTKVWAATTKWQGCIEERNTTATASFSTLPPDLDPDLVPSDDATRWRPLWPEVTYSRRPPQYGFAVGTVQTTNQDNSFDNDPGDYGEVDDFYFNLGSANLLGAGTVSCGKQAQRLAVSSRTQISNYVNAADFKPIGGTYHDVGMIWATRLISPNGIFAADTAAWPNRNAPNRHIIFMTDGNMAPSPLIYGLYGQELLDQRVTGGDYTTQLARHNARFVAACAAAKARNITVWVIAFSSATSLTTEMTQCASPGKAYYASDTAALKLAFQQIAAQIAELRITK